MSTFKGKSGREYEFKLNLGIARRLVSDFNLDIFGNSFGAVPGGAFCVDLAIKMLLLDVPRNLRKKVNDEIELDLSSVEALEGVSIAVSGELVSFFQRLGMLPEPAKAKTDSGTGGQSTDSARSPGSKASKSSRSEK